jgi:hypothetical protein
MRVMWGRRRNCHEGVHAESYKAMHRHVNKALGAPRKGKDGARAYMAGFYAPCTSMEVHALLHRCRQMLILGQLPTFNKRLIFSRFASSLGYERQVEEGTCWAVTATALFARARIAGANGLQGLL